MADGDDTYGQAYQTGPNAYGPQSDGDGATSAYRMNLPPAATYQTQTPVTLGRLAPDYEAQRDARIDVLAQRESGNQNITNRIDPARSSASGPWQMTNPTWKTGAKLPGTGDAAKYPTAQSAPVSTQRNVVRAVYDQYGERPWAETVRSSPVRVASRALADYTDK